MPEEEGVYGRNDPPEEDTGVLTARDFDPDNIRPEHEKGVGEIMDEDRRRKASEQSGGGMGRPDVPRDPATQGKWHDENPNVQQVPLNENNSDQAPD